MSEEKTFQPEWGKKHKHHHHHGGYSSSGSRNRGWGGSLRMRDRQAYIGLMLVLVVGLAIAIYMFSKWAVHEIRSMPLDDPSTELAVDELRIHKVAERDALLASDSLAQTYQFDSSTVKHVQIPTRSVYRPPRKDNSWYITKKEWKEIWQSIRLSRMERRQDAQEKQEKQADQQAEK